MPPPFYGVSCVLYRKPEKQSQRLYLNAARPASWSEARRVARPACLVTERRTLRRQELMQQPNQGRQLATARAQQGERHVLPLPVRTQRDQPAAGKIVLEGW
jgi:hypothetical protein